jgi:hypothetical protein
MVPPEKFDKIAPTRDRRRGAKLRGKTIIASLIFKLILHSSGDAA